MTPQGIFTILTLVFLLTCLLFGFWVAFLVSGVLGVAALFGVAWNIADSMDYEDDE